MLICGSSCADESEREYKKQSKGTGDCKKNCPKDKEEDGGECEKNCKSEGMLSYQSCVHIEASKNPNRMQMLTDKSIEKEAEKKATKSYSKCNEKCFSTDSVFMSTFKVSF